MEAAADEKMTCMEVWGGNQSTWSHFVVPGLDVWVYSRPVAGDESGGDVYYVSSCASGRITRMLLGDVSGHGAEASPLAGKLRDIMRRNVNYVDQSRVVEVLNEQFEEEAAVGRFATAIVCTYVSSLRSLTVCSAGHPPPLIYRARAGKWDVFSHEDGRGTVRNLPIGIASEREFQSSRVRVQVGDMILGYTDSLFEATDAEGAQLGAEGLVAIANSISMDQPGSFVSNLLEQIEQICPQGLTADDTTVILAAVSRRGVPIRNDLLVPFRLLRGLFSRN